MLTKIVSSKMMYFDSSSFLKMKNSFLKMKK